MWERRTFHECAAELSTISEDFRAANRKRLDQVMLETSQRGVELLRILALSIRGDQDHGLIDNVPTAVGALRSGATEDEVISVIRDYRPPYDQLSGFTALGLRQALNKIAHADPTRSGFFANNENHDLILSGVDQGRTWVAVISLIDLCRVIKSLPDIHTPGSGVAEDHKELIERLGPGVLRLTCTARAPSPAFLRVGGKFGAANGLIVEHI
jgi:hypothetical protein